MKPMSLTSPESIAREYGGNKKAIADAARMGLVDPTAAVMAGMFIDRMRSAASEEQKPDTTVAQDVFGLPTAPQPQQTAPQPQQTAPRPQPQMPQPQGIPGAQMAAAQPRMAPGVEGLPTGDVGNYAGGGIVAFAGGMTDEQAQALGYSNAAEYYAFQDIQRGATNDTAVVPSANMEVRDLRPISNNDRTSAANTTEEVFARLRNNPYQNDVTQDTPEARIDRAQTTKELLSQYGVEGPVPFYLTEEDKRKNAKLMNEGEQFKRREIGRRGAEAANKEFGLAGIMKGPNLNIPFNRVAPDAASKATTRSDLPPSVAAKPAAPAPRVDAYNLQVPDSRANAALGKEIADSLIKIPPEESQADAIAATKNLYRDMGVDPDIYKKQSTKLEEERMGLKADKEEAKYSRLIEAGLGILGGTSPFAAVNIGQGASPAMKGFAQDIKDVKKADRELNRAKMALETTENQFKIDQSKSVQGRMEKNQERVDKAQQTRATAAATVASSINVLTGSIYGDQTRDLTARFTAEQQRDASMYSADQSLRGSLAQASAARHSADKEDRGIEKIRNENPSMTYLEAYETFHKGRNAREFDRYNAARIAMSKAEALMAGDQNIKIMKGKLRELSKDPVGNKTAIIQQQNAIDAAEMEYYSGANVTKDTIDYVREEDKRMLEGVRGKKPPAASDASPTKPAQLPAGTPKGATYGAYVQGKGWEIKDGNGKLIGYGQ